MVCGGGLELQSEDIYHGVHLASCFPVLEVEMDHIVLPKLSWRDQFFKFDDKIFMSSQRPFSASSQDGLVSRIARSSAYLYFLDWVTGKTLIYILNNIIRASTEP